MEITQKDFLSILDYERNELETILELCKEQKPLAREHDFDNTTVGQAESPRGVSEPVLIGIVFIREDIRVEGKPFDVSLASIFDLYAHQGEGCSCVTPARGRWDHERPDIRRRVRPECVSA